MEISAEPGSGFLAFDGAVTGSTLLVVPNQMIVQLWRGAVWEDGDPDSLCVLTFDSTPAGASVDLLHANSPDQFEERWSKLY